MAGREYVSKFQLVVDPEEQRRRDAIAQGIVQDELTTAIDAGDARSASHLQQELKNRFSGKTGVAPTFTETPAFASETSAPSSTPDGWTVIDPGWTRKKPQAATPSGWEDVSSQFYYAGAQPKEQQPDDSFTGSMARGIKKTIPELKQAGAGAIAYLGDVFGAEGVKEWGLNKYHEIEDSTKNLQSANDSFSKVVLDGEGSFKAWLGNAVGYSIGQVGLALVSGGVGAIGGKMIAKQGLTKLVEGEIAKSFEKNVAAGMAEEAAKAAAIKTGQEFAAGALVAGRNTGAFTGALLHNETQELGSIYNDAVEQAKKEGRTLDGGDLFRIGASSLAAAGVDTAMEAVNFNKLTKGVDGSKLYKRAAVEIPSGMAGEGVTEAVQTGIEQYGAAKPLDTREIIDSAALGAVGGGMAGGGAALRQRQAPTASDAQTIEQAATLPVTPVVSPEDVLAIQPQSSLVALSPREQRQQAVADKLYPLPTQRETAPTADRQLEAINAINPLPEQRDGTIGVRQTPFTDAEIAAGVEPQKNESQQSPQAAAIALGARTLKKGDTVELDDGGSFTIDGAGPMKRSNPDGPWIYNVIWDNGKNAAFDDAEMSQQLGPQPYRSADFEQKYSAPAVVKRSEAEPQKNESQQSPHSTENAANTPVFDPPIIGSDAKNGFQHGPDGTKYRIGVSDAVGGAIALEMRYPAGTIGTFYVTTAGTLIDADGINLISDQGKLWVPKNEEQSTKVQELLRERAQLALTDPKRKTLLAAIREIVTNTQPNNAPILSANGQPFATLKAAETSIKARGLSGAVAVSVKGGGFGIRMAAPAAQTVAPAPAVQQVAPPPPSPAPVQDTSLKATATLAQAIRKFGGLPEKFARDLTGEPATTANKMPGYRGLFHARGTDLSTLVHDGKLDAYLPPNLRSDVRDDSRPTDTDAAVAYIEAILRNGEAQTAKSYARTEAKQQRLTAAAQKQQVVAPIEKGDTQASADAISEAEYEHYKQTGEPGFGWMPARTDAIEAVAELSDDDLAIAALVDFTKETQDASPIQEVAGRDSQAQEAPASGSETDNRARAEAPPTAEVAKTGDERARDAELFRKTKSRLIDAFIGKSGENFDELSKTLTARANDKNDPQSKLAAEVLDNFDGWKGNYEQRQAFEKNRESANPNEAAAKALESAAAALREVGKPSAKPTTTAEDAIRAAANAVPNRTIGSWYPITVEFNGVTQQFLSNIKRVVSDGKTSPAIHLLKLKIGRLVSWEEARPLVNGYRLTSANHLVEEGIPRDPSEQELARWEKAFGALESARPALDLTNPTESKLRTDDAKQKRDAAEKAAKENAPSPEEFGLVGSNRAADVGAAAGQEPLFSRASGKNAGMANDKNVVGNTTGRYADDVNSGATAASQMLDAIERDPYADYAIRVIPGEFTGSVNVGDTLPVSNKWEDGTDTGEPLRGTSGIGIEQRSLKGVEQAIHRIGSSKTAGPNGFYFGNRVVLIKGESVASGEDVGESIIQNAEVVGVWTKPTKGKSEVQPNEQTTSQDGDVAFSRSDTIEVDGQQRSRNNSNGKPIAATDEGIRNFWRWFAGSRVVDEQGRPLVVYHGTNGDFNTFSFEFQKAERGFFFSPSPEIASQYAGYDETFPSPKIGSVIPAYLKIEALEVVDFEGRKYGRPDAVSRARENGFDGLAIKNHYDAGGVQDQYVAFNEAQIKSALGNTGQFSPDNADIRYSRDEQQPATTNTHAADVIAKAAKTVNIPLDVYATPQEASAKLGIDIPSDVRGLYYKGRAALISSNITTRAMGEFVLWHELFHAGITQVAPRYGNEYNRIMQDMAARNGNIVKAARDWRNSYGAETIKRSMDAGLSQEQAEKRMRLMAIEEAIADLAGANVELKGWTQFVAKLQALLRSMGFDNLANWIEGKSNAEVLQLIARTREEVTTQNLHLTTQVPAFARDEDDASYQRAYHGTPHKFDKFSLDKIGTGEGAQAYGYGLYFASKREIAEHYRNTLASQRGFSYKGQSGLTRAEVQDLVNAEVGGKYLDGVARGSGVADTVIDDMMVGTLRKDGQLPKQYKAGSERAALYEKLKGEITHADPGALYQVDIPEDSEMLHWDKPLSEQPEAVKVALEKSNPALFQKNWYDAETKQPTELGETSGKMLNGVLSEVMDGSEYYRSLSSQTGGGAQASTKLRSLGIRGIKYLDGGSRNAGDGSYNYVVFDDKDVSIEAVHSRADDVSAIQRKIAQQESFNAQRAAKLPDDHPWIIRDKKALAQLQKELTDAKEKSAGFDRWFEGSKAVDARGNPLVLYHGTSNDFSAFRRKTGGRAIWAADTETANSYAGESDGSNVMPVYMAMRNPLTVNADGATWQDLWFEGERLGADHLADIAEERGHDGLIIRDLRDHDTDEGGEIPADHYAVFKPNQIKSATGNTGAFSPDNADIRFSRNEQTTSQDGDVAFSRTGSGDIFDKNATAAQSTYNGTEAVQGMGMSVKNVMRQTANIARDKRGAALSFLGGRQIADIYSKDVPELPKYNEILQRMQAEQNEGSAVADSIIEKWRVINRKRPDVATQLSSLMHDSTLAQVDPDVSADNAELRKRWINLPQEAKDIYREARDAYVAHFEKVKAELIDRVERSALDTNAKNRTLASMREEFTKAMKGVYFPLARFGDYMVVVKDKAGVTQSVSMAETTNQAQALRAELLRAYPDYVVGAIQKKKEFNAERDGVSRGFMKDLVALISEEPDAQTRDSQLDAINQLWLSSLPDLSWAKSGIHRKGTPGYSNDAMRAFARNMFHGGYHLAKLRYGDRLGDTLAQMQETIDNKVRSNPEYSNVVAQSVVDEMNARHKHVMNPQNTPVANALTGLGFMWHMGLSPASAVVNLSQTALVAYPMLASKFGFGKAATMLLSLSADAVKGKNDLLSQLQGTEKDAYDRAVREGLIDVTMAHDLAGVSQGKSGEFNEKQQRVMRVASVMFHEAEKFNRGVTFMSAYRLAVQSGVSDPYKLAHDLTFDSHFDYSSQNRPRVMQGPTARVILLFKQYGQNMIYTLSRNTFKALQGDREAQKTLAGLLAMHGMFAGALGLPLMTTLLAAASAIGGSDDEPWDAQVALRNYLADAFGKDIGEVLAHGVFRAPGIKDAIGADISGRVGLDSMLIRMPQETLEGKKYYQALLETIAGPVFGIGGNIANGMQTMAQGNTLRGIEEMLPKSIKDPLKAYRYEQDGIQDKTGITIVDETTIPEEIAQFLGFSPARGMEGFEGKSAIKNQETLLTQRRRQLMQRYGKDAEEGDTADSLTAIQRWNIANPTMAIKGQDLLRSMREKAKRQAEAENGAYLSKKRRGLAELGEFANAE